MTERESQESGRASEIPESGAKISFEDAIQEAYLAIQERLRYAGTPMPDEAHVELDDAYYDEVRQAVGRGAPSGLLGTSTRALNRSLAQIEAVERSTPAWPDDVAPLWLWSGIGVVVSLATILFAVGLTHSGWQTGLIWAVPAALLGISAVMLIALRIRFRVAEEASRVAKARRIRTYATGGSVVFMEEPQEEPGKRND